MGLFGKKDKSKDYSPETRTILNRYMVNEIMDAKKAEIDRKCDEYGIAPKVKQLLVPTLADLPEMENRMLAVFSSYSPMGQIALAKPLTSMKTLEDIRRYFDKLSKE
jgi:hypothetical protein